MRPNLTARSRSRRSRAIASAVAIIALMLALAAPLRAQAPSPGASQNRIEAEAVDLRNSNGSFRCAMWNSADGFPRDDSKRVAGVSAKVKDGHATCVFNNLPPGDYALATFHDENDNGKMDYNFVGLPAEGYGFSNNARVFLGPPSFAAASFHYSGGVLKVPIKLHY